MVDYEKAIRKSLKSSEVDMKKLVKDFTTPYKSKSYNVKDYTKLNKIIDIKVDESNTLRRVNYELEDK